MVSRIALDPNYRPNYWQPEDPITAITHNIKGQLRREMVNDILTGRARDMAESVDRPDVANVLSEVEPELLRDELAGPSVLERFDPRWMGGEYLPKYKKGEVEIARVVLQSTTMDVYSVRARRVRDRIAYRVVDEYDGTFRGHLRGSREPLSGREMTSFLDGLVHEDLDHPGTDFFTFRWEWDLGEMGASTEEQLSEYASFMSVESPFYPGLSEWLVARAKAWVESKAKELELAEDE